ncbi:uncharacterized protein [Leptinotarsa decemlineata]|uniref:uncharacterized protein n=1 Tax=Leptinotarsa decemlineata TaxID=7539 RepID=UPI003D308976
MDAKKLISQSQCEIIMNVYHEQNSLKIKSFSVTPFQAQMDGLIGEQFILNIQYSKGEESRELKCFLKTLSDSIPVMLQLSKEILAYEKEAFYYDKLVPMLESAGMTCDYAPRSFLCQPSIIVLENLADLSYRGSGKNLSMDFAHCKMCMETLARFHLDPILLEISRHKQTGKTFKLLDEFPLLENKVFCGDDNGANRFIQHSVQGLLEIIKVIPEEGVSSNEFMEKLQQVVKEIMSYPQAPEGFRSTVLHGDLWSNNFLFLYGDENEIKHCKLLDFQTLNYGPPAIDVLQFIFTNTRKSFRDEHQKELLTYYYSYFCRLSNERGIEPSEVLSESEFWRSCDMFTLAAKIHSVVDRSITFISEERFLEAAQTDEGFSRFLYEDRGKFILKEFQSNGSFNEILTEDICELREMLFKH